MSTLTETAFQAKKFLLWGVLAIVAFIILRMLVGFLTSWWATTHPSLPPAPDVCFGKLPALKFPQNKLVPQNLSYTLGTIEGGLPQASTSARVYPLPKSSINFLSLSRAKDFARQLGFGGEPKALSSTQYQWVDSKTSLRTLTREIIDGNFILAYDYLSDPDVFQGKDVPTTSEAVSWARGILEGLGLYHPDLAAGQVKASFWKFSQGQLIPAVSFSETEAVRVDFFRGPQGNLPVVPLFYNQSPIFVLLSGSSASEKKVLTLNYNFWPPAKDVCGTYPLKTGEKAWEELKNGGGFVANIGEISPQITIRKIYLAYFDAEEYQRYLQPIFVFEGEKNFAAYVPAISPEWTE